MEIEENISENKIALSEKSDQHIKKSITYLSIGFWVVTIWMVLGLLLGLTSLMKNVSAGIMQIIIALIFGVLWIPRMRSYIKNYKQFKEEKTRLSLESLFNAQRKYYFIVYLFPVLMIVVALVAFILGDLFAALR
jgi:hypothetical protein